VQDAPEQLGQRLAHHAAVEKERSITVTIADAFTMRGFGFDAREK
jgi:hypothetical protein